MITIATAPIGSHHHASPDSPAHGVIVELRGEMDIDSAAIIEPTLSALTRSGRDELRLNLGALAFCDTSGINLFLRLHHLCVRSGTSLVLTGVTGQPARVIRLVRLHHTIDCRFVGPPSPRDLVPQAPPRRRTVVRVGECGATRP